MATFKHIRTSILPFGYKEGKYRFSLCIDINPNYDSAQADLSKKELANFLIKYGASKNGIFDIINENLKINIDGQAKEIPVSVCFPQIIDEVKNIWAAFFERNEIRSTGIPPLQSFFPQLDISPDSITTIFDKNSNDTLPEPVNIRKEAISKYESFKKNGQNKDINTLIVNEYNSLDASIVDFDNKLEGIRQFSEDYNTIQSDITLKNSKANKHVSVFDSINSILDVWSFIDSNKVFQRIFGKTIDFEISEDELKGLTDFSISFKPKTKENNDLELDTLIPSINWENLITKCKLFPEDKIIIVKEKVELDKPIKLEARNYDVGGKLIGLKAIKEKYKDYLIQVNDPAKKESEKILLRKQIIALDTAALTIGLNIYNSSLKTITEIEQNALKEKFNSDEPNLYLSDIRSGYRIAAKSNLNNTLTPLAIRTMTVNNTVGLGNSIVLPEELINQQVTINTNSGTHALLEEGGTLVKKVIVDQGMANWSGENLGFPSVFSNQEDEKNFESTIDEGSVEDSTNFVAEYFSHFIAEDYKLKGVDYFNTGKNKLVNLNTNPKEVKLLLDYSFPQVDAKKGIGNKKLIFGRRYDIILTPEYKNGWAVPFEFLHKLINENSYYLIIDQFPFKRNEPVNPIELKLHDRLTEPNNKPTELREGESLDKLVIRNLSKVDDNKIYKTQQQSIRHILPPAISFQQAFWHNRIFEMTTEESYKWYMKYHFPSEENKLLKWNLKGENIEHLNKICTLEDAIKGSTIMRSFYPNECPINYLPDPLSIGFRFEFYKDKNRLLKAKNYERYEQLEFYFSGKYPKINAWKLIFEDYNLNESELVLVNANTEEIIIRLEKGDELFISARTILTADYENQFETFGNYNEFTRYGNNDLLTPPLEFSLVHATQRPLVRPKFGNIIRPNKSYKEKERDKTILQTTITTNIEQTGIYYDESGIVHYIEENIPTGNLEVYSKWEEYKDDPKHLVTNNWTPNEPINHIDKINFKNTDKETPATFETAIEVSKQLETMEATLNKIASEKNDFRNYSVDLKISYDVKETKFIEKYFWIKNKSKFTSYFPKDWGTIDADTYNEEEQKLLKKDSRYSKEIFNRLSSDSFLVRILNSKKPNSPVVADENITLVSVTEDIKANKSIYRTASMNRLRFFFERGRLTSGNGERIGFVVNEPQAKYNDYLVKNDLISIVGRDIVSDSLKPYDGLFRNEDVLLTKANFVINDPYDLKDFVSNEKSDDLESFSPKYVKELGLMTFMPKFDKKLNLWCLDVEMDINDDKCIELHSPFLRFSIVHYQENSFNYNLVTENDIAKDCRVSEINKSRYVYILPSRNIKMEYGKTFISGKDYGYVIPKLSFDDSSVKGKLREKIAENETKFYLLIRHKRPSDVKWFMADKDKVDDGNAFYPINTRKKEDKMYFKCYTHTDYQIVILETEDWGNDNDISFDNLIENKNSRIVHVNTFEINNEEL